MDWRIGNALVDRSRIGPGLDCICGGLVKDYQICPGLASYCWIGDGFARLIDWSSIGIILVDL